MPVRSLAEASTSLNPGSITIIGAGAIGLAMAVDLARRGIHVTVLEGGPAQPPAD